MKLAAVVPTRDGRATTLRCLASLVQSDTPVVPIVVDDASRDDTLAAVKAHFPLAETIRLERRAGFAAATNAGLRRALALGADAFLLLNNDAELARDAVSRLARALDDDATGLAVPRIHDARDREKIWYAGGSFSRPLALVRHDRRNEKDDGRADPPRRVSFAPLTAALLARRAVERVGLLDERFFLYWEDVDLALRLDAAGFAITYVPDARAWHFGGLTAGRRPLERFAHETLSLGRFLAKHYSGDALAGAVLALAVHYGAARLILAVLRGEPAFVLGPLRGLGWLLEGAAWRPPAR